MATLRDNLFARPTVSTAELDRPYVEGMGSLRRGWESGRLGGEANSLGAEWASANADGDTARAATLRRQIDGLQRQQAIYRPEVAQLEDIKGIGDVPGYIAGQVGQGAASMAEPAAVATGLTALGTGLRFIPNPVAKGVGTLLQTVGAPGAAFAINQKQLKGEFVNDAVRDQELMARTSPEQLNRMANLYGVGAGLLDTALPGMVGHTLGGATLRTGLREAAGSAGGRFVRNMLMEGGTETLQDMGSKLAQGHLNPNRDTSGDLMSYANSFVGGAAGAGPFAAAEAMGDAGVHRINGVSGAVKDAAGSVVDLAKPYAQAGVDKATEVADKVRGKVIDLATGEDGTTSVSALKDNLKATSQELKSKWQATQEERDLILGTPPADIVNSDNPLLQDKWMTDNQPKRVQAIVDRLDAMGATGDQKAIELIRGMSVNDPAAQVAAVDAAADYIIGQTELGQLEKQATRFGELATKGGKAAGKAAVWAARKAGSAAKTFGTAVWDGVQEGSKKNAQGWTSQEADAEFAQRQAVRDEAIKNAVRMGEYLYTTAKSQGGKTASGPISNLLKDMGYEIAELADLSDPASLGAKPDLRRNLNSSAYSLGVNRIVNSLRVAYGPQTEQVINNLRQMAAPSAAPVFDAMAQELDVQRNDKNGAHTAQIRAASASELLGLMDAETETKLMREGINLRAPESQRQLLGMVEAVSLGRATPQARKALEGLVGRDTLNKMLAAVAPQTEQDVEGDTLADGGDVANEGFVVDDDGELGESTSSIYDQEAAEKMLAKGEGSRVYGFFGTGNRTDLNTKDPFAATTGMTRAEYKAFQEDNVNRKAMGEDPLPDPRRRPRLFTKDQQLSEKSGGGSAMAKRIADMEKYLKVDRTPERMAALMREEGNQAGAKKVEALIARGDDSAKATLDNAMKSFFVNRAGGWRVSAKSAWDVLKGQNAQPTKVLALYRDYLRQDGDNERAELANKTMLDMMDQSKGETTNLRVQAGTRRKIVQDAEAYFRGREIAVAERLSNRDPMKLDETELLQMHESAQKIVDLARKDGGNKMIAAANILTFKSDLSPNGKLLHIKVSDLVREVQKRQNESTGNDFENNSESLSNANKNQKYLDMVLEGVGMVMDSGRVDGWPYKLNDKNQKEYFGEGANGVPPSLMLATTTNQGFLFGKEQRVAAKTGEKVPPMAGPRDPRSVEDARYEKVGALETPRDEFVASEQDRGFYTPDDSVSVELPTERMRLGGDGWFNKNEFDTEGREDLTPEDTDFAAQKALKRTQLDAQRKPKGGRSVTGSLDEYADQRARSVSQGYDAAAISNPVERKGDAVARAAERAAPIVQALKDNFTDGLAMVERRLRTAQAPEFSKDKNTAVGGAHYVAPLAYALSAENVAMMDLNPAEAKQVQAMRVEVARVLLEGNFKQNERVTLTRALATEEAAARIAAPNVNKYLAKVVGQQAPAKEAGASLGKSQSAPSGAVDTRIPSRIGKIAEHGAAIGVHMRAGDEAVVAHQELVALAAAAWARGLSKREYMASADALLPMAKIMSAKILGKPGAQEILDQTLNAIDQTFGQPLDRDLEVAVESRLLAAPLKGAPLSTFLGEIAVSDLPDGAKAVAKAVGKVAGDVKVRRANDDGSNTGGWYDATKDVLFLVDAPTQLGKAHTLLHEGVHAATVHAMHADRELHAATYALMAHVVQQNPRLSSAYGLTNTLEFLAEGLSNRELQRELYKLPASSAVEKYLGKTLANAWEAFVGLMRKALKLPDHHTSALTQLIELGGRAMKSVAGTQDRRFDVAAQEGFVKRPMVPVGKVMEALREITSSPLINEHERRAMEAMVGDLEEEGKVNGGKVPHSTAVTIETARALIPLLASVPGSIGEEFITGLMSDIARGLGAKALPNKLNARADYLYHGTRADESALVDADGNLVLKPSKNFGGKTLGVSFTDDVDSARDYATRIKGGGPKGFTFTGAKVLKIARDALTGVEAEAMREWADYSGKDVVVPKGKYEVVPVSRDRHYFRDSHLADGFREWMRGSYSEWEREEIYQLDDWEGDYQERYLEEIVDQPDGYPAKDVAEAKAVLRDQFGRKFNTQAGTNTAQKSTQAERDVAVAEIRRTLGDKIKVEFADITGYSGEFIDADNLIRISTTPAAGTLQTAYHESLHAFFKQFVRGNPLAMDVVKALAEHQPTLDRVHALLDGYPEAQAALANGEERLAYMYQFWRADLLDLPYGKPRNLFQKVLKFFRQVLGQVSDLERSTELLVALRSGQLAGEPSVAGKVIAKTLAQGTWTRKQLRKMDGLTQMIAAAVLPANDVLASSDSLTAKKLAVTFWTNPGDGSDGLANEGYLNARARMAARYVNEFSRFIADLNDRDLKDMTTALQREDADLDAIPFAPTREAAKHVRALIQRFRKYMVDEKGLKLGDRGPNYFPRVWDTDALMQNQTEFMNLLVEKYGDRLYGNGLEAKRQSAMRLFNTLITNNMVDGKLPAERDDGVLTPFFAQGQTRDLAWLDGADIAKYQSKDAIKTLTTYFHAGARAAEYAARFGQKGEKLNAALNDVEVELIQAAKKRERRGEFKDGEARDKWVERQMRDVRRSIDAMEGSIGKDGNMTMRKFGSAMTVYQNVRLLPLAIFSQVVDPLGMVARGATMKQAYESFLRGMKEVGQSWADIFREVPKERKADQWEKLAMAVGSVDAAMFSHHVSEEYSSTYMSPTARKINDKFFRLNGMEAWNRGMRVGATKAAVQFLQHHKSKPSEHSVRWLKELGLSPADVLVDDEGDLLTDWRSIQAKTGWTEEQARAHTDRIHYALNRWVQGAVLTPNAAQRPAWSSDPSYSMFFHLKQFSYSFHQTILKRAVKELEYGNLAPLGSFAWYIPAMIAADVTKGLMLNGGELPPHLKGMDLGDWVMHGIDRSGALGIGGIGVDAAEDVASLGGPAVEQIIDGMRDDIGATTLKALPAHGLYKAMVN